MAKKKRGKKSSKRKSSRSKIKSPVRSTKRKIIVALRSLLFFVALSLLSFLLSTSNQEIFKNLFSILSITFGFISVGFLIVLLTLLFMKILKK